MLFIRTRKGMGNILKISIPISKYLCDGCRNKNNINFSKDVGTVNTIYSIPTEIAGERLTVVVDVKKINWKQVGIGMYQAYSEMKVECPLCDNFHNMQFKLKAPMLLIESSKRCLLCDGKLKFVDDEIVIDDCEGMEQLSVQGKLICEKCYQIQELKFAQKIETDFENYQYIKVDGGEKLNMRYEHNDKTLEKKRFKIALSFPGEYRESVIEKIALELADIFSEDDILYDMFHQAEFARMDLDIYLQNLYRNQSELIVVFLCKDYNIKPWCGVEWRAIRDLANHKEGHDRLMLVQVGDGDVDGIFGTVDGHITASADNVEKVVKQICCRYELLKALVSNN